MTAGSQPTLSRQAQVCEAEMTAATAVLFFLYVTAVCMFAPHLFCAIPLLFLGWRALDGVV
jgi:hypothetical protein